MFSILFLKEIRGHLMTFRFGAALITTFVLVVISAWVLGEDFKDQMNAYSRQVEHNKLSLANAPVPSAVFPVLFRLPSALSIFSQGETANLGNSVEIRRWSTPKSVSGSLRGNPLIKAYPAFDMATIFSIVISLFGILLSYDSISGERTAGTLKQICSFRVSRAAIYSSKFAAGAVVLAIPFIISLLLSLMLFQFVLNISFSPEEWISIGVMVFAGIIYGSLFIGFGLVCSSLTKHSSTSLLLSLLFWTMSVVLMPSIAKSIATVMTPLDSKSEITRFEEMRNEEIKKEENNKFKMDYGNVILIDSINNGEEYYTYDGSKDGLDILRDKSVFMESEHQKKAMEVWQLQEKRNSFKRKQKATAELISFLAPVSHLNNVFSSLAKTDYQTYELFLESARRYRTQMLANMRKKGYFSDDAESFFSSINASQNKSPEQFYQRLEELRGKFSSMEEFDSKKWSEPLDLSFLPSFQGAGQAVDFNSALYPFAVLFIMMILVYLFGYTIFLKYDVR